MDLSNKISYLNQQESIIFDDRMMSPEFGFVIENMMEMAGMSCAHALDHANNNFHSGNIKNILILCGPGNNVNFKLFT